MGLARRLAPGLAMICLSAPAIANVLPIAGAYGNAAGCAFFLSGQAGAGMELLTGESLASPAGGCDFVRPLPSATGDGVFIAEAACDGIGKINEGPDRVLVELRPDEGYYVMIENAEVAGPLSPCPGAAEALSPGVRI